MFKGFSYNITDKLRDKQLLIILGVVCLLSRLPFLKTFELVAYDGTYYLNQAKTLFSGHMAGSFPVGYPFLVRLFHLFLRDYQLAGMVVAFVAAAGSTVVVFLLARRYISRELAFLAALTPSWFFLMTLTLESIKRAGLSINSPWEGMISSTSRSLYLFRVEIMPSTPPERTL